jgi:glucokinase
MAREGAARYAGFDIGGTELKFGLIDGAGRLVLKDRLPSPESAADLMRAVRSAWEKLREAAGGGIRSCGFGVAGFFSLKEQRILHSPNYPSLDNFPLRRELGKFIDAPFTIDNDANMAAFGEFARGSGRGSRSLVLLTVGTGIGSGIIIDGRLWQGRCGFAGELGHITVNPEGDACGCGSRGCFETEVSGPRLVRNYRDFGGRRRVATPRDVYLLAKKGDRAALKSFERCGYYLGIGLGIIINFLNPELVVIGGGVVSAGKYLLGPALKEAGRRSNPILFKCTRIIRASLGNDAGLIGSAAWSRLHAGPRN